MTKLPVNFLYLGGDKCGSTWIHHILSHHPDVRLAKAKELFYFDRFYSKGSDWYLRQFPDWKGETRTGEICHDYLYSAPALHRIASDVSSDARFLITVRDPVQRTLSHYKYLRKIGRTKDSFADALRSQRQIVEHSMFGRHVTRAINVLGAERVRILRFELLRENPVAFGKALSNALGIPFLPELPYANKVLEAQAARHPGLVRILRNVAWGVRHLGAPRLVGQIKSNPLIQRALFSQPNQAEQAILPLPVAERLKAHFAPDQELLQKLPPQLMSPAE